MKHHLTAHTPPMGWNSWDCYGAAVREEEVRGNAQYMAEHLKEYGWEYVVVDIQWYESGAVSSQYRPFVPLEMDSYSRLIPAVNRFPSAADGRDFQALAEYVHGLGLKFGIHIMRGISRQAVHQDTPILGTTATARQIAHPNSICPWNTDMYGVDASKEGAQEYYNSLFDLYAEWGVDFVKVDDIAASRLYGIHLTEIELIKRAIAQCGRPMVLSLSPGPAPLEHASDLIANANMWRMTDDFWDVWPLLYGMFERCEKWAEHVGPGHWPDCDMLPLGHLGIRSVDSVDSGSHDRWTRFTKDEQLTMMTLWSIFRSPLMFGGELRDNDEWTLSLLTNKEVLDVHHNGVNARQVYRKDEHIVWTSHNEEGHVYAALFNAGDEASTVRVSLQELGIEGQASARDLWNHVDLGDIVQELSADLPPHGAALFIIK
ncbi:glycoside hydrolase family 27 protein [Paenibacillus sp. AK121]|uniref:glycoside hydrolase family 27 protein n=1 Tax=Paenibacillus TaxID=44249 RepID=UPI001C23EBC9|nr:glycoside hydrolase family 27 protein [Paenibacillus sp. AK121]MBU9709558.1 glycoside hydrolase family 27 protein [Paenibacillus sp. AK121]MEE4570372.1 glycoside hydrolase family 27 protein [Paenibacillus polymyxa]